jgi:hypothetical protein
MSSVVLETCREEKISTNKPETRQEIKKGIKREAMKDSGKLIP